MINTIFYYPNSKTEYDQQAGNISSRTISFVPMGDTGVIYKNGVRYGSPTADDIRNIFNENPYALPIATASKLGGIMIGKGFNIDPTTGKLDVDFSSITNGSDGQDGHNGLDGLIKNIFTNISNIRASRNDYGIVKVGDGINVEDGIISVDFSNVDLSEIENDITSLKASVGLHTNAITDITGRISSAEATLATKASASDFTSLSNRIGSAESILTSLSASTSAHSRSITDLENRISTAETGLEAKANASSVYSKSEIDGKISTINSVISNLSGGADIDLSAITDLENEIATVKASLSSKADASSVYSKSYIDDKFSSVETTLSTLGASSGVDTSAITDLVNRISTAESTLQSKANASETYTKTEIDGKVSTLETSMTTLGASGGISNTAITDLKNRMSSAETSISSKANASETYTKTEVDNKVTALTTRIDTLDASAGVDTSSITDLVNRIAAAETTLQSKADSSTTYTKTDIDGKVTTLQNSISANSGLKTAADVKSAFESDNETIYTSATSSATLFAKIKDNADEYYAGIDVAVKKVNAGTTSSPDYRIESGVKINADKVNIDAQHQLDLSAQNISINADNIVMNSSHKLTITGDNVTFDSTAITALNAALTAKSLYVENDGIPVAQIDSTGRCQFNNGSVYIPAITKNGATGEINYNSSGLVVSYDGLKSYYQNSGFAIESTGGTIYDGFSGSSNTVNVRNYTYGLNSTSAGFTASATAGSGSTPYIEIGASNNSGKIALVSPVDAHYPLTINNGLSVNASGTARTGISKVITYNDGDGNTRYMTFASGILVYDGNDFSAANSIIN